MQQVLFGLFCFFFGLWFILVRQLKLNSKIIIQIVSLCDYMAFQHGLFKMSVKICLHFKAFSFLI